MGKAVLCIFRWAKHKQSCMEKFEEKLKDKRYGGMVPLIVCTLHTIHNAFRKETSVGSFGGMAEQLYFDLNAWYKVYFCCSVIVQPFGFAIIVLLCLIVL